MIEIIIIKSQIEIHTEEILLDSFYQAISNSMVVTCNLDGFITIIKAALRGMKIETLIKKHLIKKIHSKVKREINKPIKEELFITMKKKNPERLRLLKIHQKKPKFQL